jgi:hypothetical protein
MTMLTAERLREVLDYNPETGIFRWKAISTKNQVKVGDIAGCAGAKDYRRICIDGRLHLTHRLAWLYMTGEWPVADIDHINGISGDNRFANLREATRSENMQNRRGPNRDSKTGLLGASPNQGKYEAAICLDGKKHYLGLFKTAEQAHAAYIKAKRKFHPGGTI